MNNQLPVKKITHTEDDQFYMVDGDKFAAATVEELLALELPAEVGISAEAWQAAIAKQLSQKYIVKMIEEQEKYGESIRRVLLQVCEVIQSMTYKHWSWKTETFEKRGW